jgi:hypothetical protein
MIETERQYQITKAAAERFEHALDEMKRGANEGAVLHPQLRTAQQAAIQSQLDDLHAELRDYEARQSA